MKWIWLFLSALANFGLINLWLDIKSVMWATNWLAVVATGIIFLAAGFGVLRDSIESFTK